MSTWRTAVGTALIGLAVILMVSPVGTQAADEEPIHSVGDRLDGFQLSDFRGREYTLDSFAESPVVVLAFLGTECPLARLYVPKLNRLVEQYGEQGVQVVGINSNRQDAVSELAAQARRQSIEFPLLKDVGNGLADAVGATRTPEVFVLDRDRIIRYQGRIDNQYGVGTARDQSESNELVDAIESLLHGEPIAVPYCETLGCLIGRVRPANAESEVTYSNQIARIMQLRCVECHREGEIAPFALEEYEEVAGWAEMIDEVVREQRMPPWHADPEHGLFRNDRSLTREEKDLIAEWVREGAPEGDPAQLPEPIEFVDGWQLPREPDLVVEITPEPVRVKAEGVVEYKYYEVDPGLEEDRWIHAAQLLPGNRAVTHHILAFARAPGESLEGAGGGARGFLVGYVPGLRVDPYPPGMAKLIPAGSTFVFQVHYTPIGTEQFDQSSLALVFADESEVEYEVVTSSALQTDIQIPPRTEAHPVSANSTLPMEDYLLLSMMPHMHLRGSAFSYEAIFPGEQREMLLNIPSYDFNWQTSYRLAEPIVLPSGTRLFCTAEFDNSEGNLNNPDPDRWVGWGDQTWDEMMIGYFDVAIPIEEAQRIREERHNRSPRDRLRDRAAEMIRQYDQDGDSMVSRDEMPERLRRLFDRLDRDEDGQLTQEELVDGIRR